MGCFWSRGRRGGSTHKDKACEHLGTIFPRTSQDPNLRLRDFLQHFSNVPSVKRPVGFAKILYQGRPLAPPQAPKNAPKQFKRNVLGTTRGAHLGEEHVK